MRSVCIVQLRVAFNNIITMSVAQKCFVGEFILPAGNKLTSSYTASDIFLRFQPSAEFLDIFFFINATDTKFRVNPSSGSRTDTDGRTLRS